MITSVPPTQTEAHHKVTKPWPYTACSITIYGYKFKKYLNHIESKDNSLLLEDLEYNTIFPLTPRRLKGKCGYNSKHS
jgi:hypothetical protein